MQTKINQIPALLSKTPLHQMDKNGKTPLRKNTWQNNNSVCALLKPKINSQINTTDSTDPVNY